jgi:uncharacterized membrane protein
LLVIGFEGTDEHPKIRAELDKLRSNDVVRLIDLAVIRKDTDGNVTLRQESDLTTDEATEMGALVGALIGLGAGGGDEDVALATAAVGADAGSDGSLLVEDDSVWFLEESIPPGATAASALVEHRWAIPLRDSIREGGGELLADAWIHAADLVGIGLLAAEEAQAH